MLDTGCSISIRKSRFWLSLTDSLTFLYIYTPKRLFMKKTVLSLIVICCLVSCNNKSEKKAVGNDTTSSNRETVKPAGKSIIGKWKPVKVDLPELSEENKQNLLNYATLEFAADGRFITTMKADTKTGTYQFNEQDGMLVTKTSAGKEETFRVSWDNDQVELTNEEGKVTMKRL